MHATSRRTDSWHSDFSSKDLMPAVVTVEQAGSTYALGAPMVHQAVMVPGTVTLFLRGPYGTDRAHAATDRCPTSEPGPT